MTKQNNQINNSESMYTFTSLLGLHSLANYTFLKICYILYQYPSNYFTLCAITFSFSILNQCSKWKFTSWANSLVTSNKDFYLEKLCNI